MTGVPGAEEEADEEPAPALVTLLLELADDPATDCDD